MTLSLMRLPDFLIIGAAKSGTTTLYQYLQQHPQVFSSRESESSLRIKEPNFFGDDANYCKGLEVYTSMFAGAASDQICGEASTDYAKWPLYPHCAERIYQAIPNVKLIYIMRNPIERAFSHYVHLMSRTRSFQGFQETFEEHIARTNVCLDTSNYVMQIEQYLKFFPQESFLFLLMENLIQNPVSVLQEICQFLGVDDSIDLTQSGKVAANPARAVLQGKVRGQVMAPLKRLPGATLIAQKLPQRWRDHAYHLMAGTRYGGEVQAQYKPEKIKPETYQVLVKQFYEPNQKLATLINRDLSHWSKV